MTNHELLEAVSELVRQSDANSLLPAVVALLHHERPHFHWIGVYLVEGNQLVLGPYIGKPTTHVRIPLDQGICGAAASTGETLIVDDVHADARYLACSLETRSEIVVPIRREGRVLGEIDIDSNLPAAFTYDDRDLLEAVASLVANNITPPLRAETSE